MRLCALLISAMLVQSSFATETAVPKSHLEFAGVRYAYLDHSTLWTGADGIQHIIVVFAEAPDFEAISLVSRSGTAAPHLVTPDCDVALAHVGVYLVSRSSKKLLVRIIDWGSPQSTDAKIVRKYVEEALKRPNQTPEPTPLAVTIPADAGLAPSSVVAHL
jgi:hypothetical protein